jgi:hypothetical protein
MGQARTQNAQNLTPMAAVGQTSQEVVALSYNKSFAAGPTRCHVICKGKRRATRRAAELHRLGGMHNARRPDGQR